ncbi:hypothetical protein VK792_14545 [Mesobacterium sp. TK19101]|uniref:SH3b domain-containing protein n=1 Tax=Mesobacterium hydrothermale TaxID=3111907 RepID=A0ABU6HKR9_9RHOB|nr:hypothetical protein [Mesobacterium sp. TK19101]MEC3862509.1 hypothetical protein [Mesobacterium sp. TK19101]
MRVLLPFLVIWLCALSPASQAADIAIDNTLLQRMAGLTRMYPVQGPASVQGRRTPVFLAAPSAYSDAAPDGLVGVGESYDIIRFDGPVVQGDAEKLAQVLRAPTGHPAKFIVFNSPGGNFLEGIRIGEVIQADLASQDPSIRGLYVLNGDGCHSACAVAFTMGADKRSDDTRFIEYGAAVGFHMPYLSGDKGDGQIPINEAMDLAYEITAAYNVIITEGLSPPVLLRDALRHRSADSLFILSGNLQAWAYGFTPVARNPLIRPLGWSGITLADVQGMCFTAFAAGRGFKSAADLEFGIVETYPHPDGMLLQELAQQLGSASVTFTTQGGAQCQMSLRDDGTMGLLSWQGGANCLSGRGGPTPSIAPCASLPGGLNTVRAALLADTFGCSNGVQATAGLSWYNALNSPRLRDDMVFPIRQQTRVLRNVSLRDAPATGGQRLTVLEAGPQTYAITGCRVTNDDQALWLQLATPDGTGWISARFAAPPDDLKWNSPFVPQRP